MKRISVRAVVCGISFLFVCAPGARAQAGATRVTTSDMAWLAGRWEGRMTGNDAARSETIFGPPAAGVITGVMRLIQDGKVVVVELITLIDTADGVEMRFRHFSPALEAYEPVYSQNMKLKARDGDDFRFENTVAYDEKLMSTQPRVSHFIRTGNDTFTGRSDILSGASKPSVIEVTYRKAAER